eukprot:3305127-Rhodomonas_salina.4
MQEWETRGWIDKRVRAMLGDGEQLGAVIEALARRGAAARSRLQRIREMQETTRPSQQSSCQTHWFVVLASGAGESSCLAKGHYIAVSKLPASRLKGAFLKVEIIGAVISKDNVPDPLALSPGSVTLRVDLQL